MRAKQATFAVRLMLALTLSGSGAVLTVGQARSSVFGHCIGDCDDGGSVTIDELILGVRIALAQARPDACPAGGPGALGIEGLITAVRNSLAGCTTVRDLSGFEEFVYELTPAFGFCPTVGAVHRAVINRQGGTYVLERAVIDTGMPGEEGCLPGYLTSACLISRPLPCRALSSDEVQQLHQVFTQITVWTSPDSFCLVGVEDPCLVIEVRWDGLQTNDHTCARQPRLDHAQSARLTALIESLGAGPEVPCAGQ